MRTLAIILFTALTTVANANEQPRRNIEQSVQRSTLVVEGVVSDIKTIAVEEVKGEGAPLHIRKCRATLKLKHLYKGILNDTEKASETIIVTFDVISDDRFEGERVPPLTVGGRYFFFIEKFDASDKENRIALLRSKNCVRSPEEVAADPTASRAMSFK